MLRFPPQATRRLVLLLIWSITAPVSARDLYVDPRVGDDRANGLAAIANASNGPVKSIAKGLKLAGPGDTVHLAPVVYRESAVFYARAGTAGNPITLDGHGATLDGSEPINPADWNEVAPGLFATDRLLPHDDAVIQRWFFLWNGKMNRMNRTSKGTKAPFKKPEELQPGEWTYVKAPQASPAKSRLNQGTFYLKLEPGLALASAGIAAPMRSAGVQFSGTNKFIIVRNLTATHVYNDGFNIHGICRDCRFEKIRAIDCGDDGISAHDDCQFQVDGFVSMGNSTGICDVGHSRTDYDHVFVRGCLAFDLYFLETNQHSVRNALVISSSEHPLSVSGAATGDKVCRLTLDNVLLRRQGRPTEVRIAKGSELHAKRVSFIGVNLQAVGGIVNLEQSHLTGSPAPGLLIWKEVVWKGRANLYQLGSLRLDKTSFTPSTFSEFQKLTGSETASTWLPLAEAAPTPRDVGADQASLEKQFAEFAPF